MCQTVLLALRYSATPYIGHKGDTNTGDIETDWKQRGSISEWP